MNNRIYTVFSIFLFFIYITSSTIFSQNFTKVTDASNPIVTAGFPVNYSGAAWIDYDNDGDLDLSTTPNFLFRNDGGGAFTEIETDIGIDQTSQNSNGISWADYDNDGDIDCFMAGNPNSIYRNMGNDTFEKVSTSEFNETNKTRGWACAWGDYDNDGYVDLFIAHPRGFLGPSIPSLLFHNDGAGQLSKIDGLEFTTELAPYTVGTWNDYDLDGDIDLFIGSGPANGTIERDYLYTNEIKETGEFNLTRIETNPFGTDLQDGQVWNWIDYDNDGDLDGYVTNYSGISNQFYRNDDGLYVNVINDLVIDGAYLANTWGDMDNDGDLDVIITGDTGTKYFINRGDGSFADASSQLESSAGTVGASLGDFDEDGDLDVFFSSSTSGLYVNESPGGNNWLQIDLKGNVSNRSAIGAKIRAKAKIGGVDTWQIREISAQNSFNSQNSLRAHFGFAEAANIDSLIIYWPAGGVDVFTDVNTNQILNIEENIPDGFLRVNFTADSTYAFNSNSVAANFKDISITDPGNPVTSWQWDFNNDGTIDSEEAEPAHTYDTPGTYDVSLTVSNGVTSRKLTLKKYITITGFLPVVTVDFLSRTLGNIDNDVAEVSDTFYVYNSGKGSDSVYVSIDYNNITSEAGIGVSPEKFELAPADSQAVVFTVYPSQIIPVNRTVIPKVLIESKFNAGQKEFTKIYQFRVRIVTPVEEEHNLPEEFNLSQNYPNPFNPSTVIQYSIPANGESAYSESVILKVYDLLGREQATLVNENQKAGNYKVEFDASGLSSGIYFYTLRAGGNVATKKMILLR